MDLLSDVLRDLRLESVVLSVAELRAPWGLAKGAVAAAPFHAVVEGHCLLEMPGSEPIELVHARPSESWTVGSLAKAVALSRTVFASRFRGLVGASVMEYVTARRMHVAADLLAESQQPLPQVASQVGYESEVSFSKAFRRWAGVPPGRCRRRASGAA